MPRPFYISAQTLKPILIYLPGLHGESSVFAGFRSLASAHFQVVEIHYSVSGSQDPVSLAAEVLETLTRRGIRNGWLLAESFSSLVAWALVAKLLSPDNRPFHIDGIILAGGFVRHPCPRLVTCLRRLIGLLPDGVYRSCWRMGGGLLSAMLWRHPGRVAEIREFVQHRCEPGDRSALDQRGRWIAVADPRSVAGQFAGPVYQLCGGWDFVVPWGWVTRMLKHATPGFRGRKIVWRASHAILWEQPEESVEQIRWWIAAEKGGEK